MLDSHAYGEDVNKASTVKAKARASKAKACSATEASRETIHDKMIQILYNPNNAIIIDWSCDGNTLIDLITNNLLNLPHNYTIM